MTRERKGFTRDEDLDGFAVELDLPYEELAFIGRYMEEYGLTDPSEAIRAILEHYDDLERRGLLPPEDPELLRRIMEEEERRG